MTQIDLSGFPPIVFPGGYCTSDCAALGSPDCGPNGFCMDARGYGGPKGCMKLCTATTATTDCRTAEGYICTDLTLFAPNAFCAPNQAPGG